MLNVLDLHKSSEIAGGGMEPERCNCSCVAVLLPVKREPISTVSKLSCMSSCIGWGCGSGYRASIIRSLITG